MCRLAPAHHAPATQRAERGFLLLALLIGLALSSIALMGAVDIWTVQRQREKEADLLFVGNQYRQAIQRYYFAAPTGTPRILPLAFVDLLEDDRYPVPVRHLRRLYPDPITGKGEWGTVRVGDRIAGIYSLSEAQPIKQRGFAPLYKGFEERPRYRDWVFEFLGAPRNQPSTNAPATPTGGERTPSTTRPTPGSQP